jgi:hypothetical protein
MASTTGVSTASQSCRNGSPCRNRLACWPGRLAHIHSAGFARLVGGSGIVRALGGGSVLRAADVDVGQARERRRQRRLTRLAVVLGVAALAVWLRILSGGSLNPLDGLRLGPEAMLWLPALLIVLLIAVVMLLPCSARGARPT